MDFKELFPIQKALDDKIYEKFPSLKDKKWDWKFTALFVELGELANEWRGFKKWSVDQKPRTYISTGICTNCAGTGNQFYDDEEEVEDDCLFCQGEGETWKNPLLEEYVDCLHFILSIGLEIGANKKFRRTNYDLRKQQNIERQFNTLFVSVSDVLINVELKRYSAAIDEYMALFEKFIDLGGMLGFNLEQIKQAYLQKNEINHQRQEGGY